MSAKCLPLPRLLLLLPLPGWPSRGRRSTGSLPSVIRLADYPQLKQLAWQLGGAQKLGPAQALELHERNWGHVDRQAMPPHERELVQRLAAALGGGRLLV